VKRKAKKVKTKFKKSKNNKLNDDNDDDDDDDIIAISDIDIPTVATSANRVIVPSTLPALDTLKRSDLPNLLSTIRSTLYSFHRSLPDVSENILTFNQPVQTLLLEVSPSVLLGCSTDEKKAPVETDLTFWSGSSVFHKNNVTVSQSAMNPSPTYDEYKLSIPGMSLLPCYSNYANDPGVLLPAYTALLERCAVYMYSTPAILFRVVLSYETPIAELAELLTDYAALSAAQKTKLDSVSGMDIGGKDDQFMMDDESESESEKE